ncbi:2615_t:CDS:2, partial [Funneliformis mosseae]
VSIAQAVLDRIFLLFLRTICDIMNLGDITIGPASDDTHLSNYGFIIAYERTSLEVSLPIKILQLSTHRSGSSLICHSYQVSRRPTPSQEPYCTSTS